MISNRLHVGFRMHFFTLFWSVTNLTFTLFRNCRFCHFYIPFNRSNIGSAVFAYHSMGLYSMCVDAVSTSCLEWHRTSNWIGSSVFAQLTVVSCDYHIPMFMSVNQSCLGWHYTSISIDSVIFTYHSIGLSSVPPFLRTIQWVYTACGLCKKN